MSNRVEQLMMVPQKGLLILAWPAIVSMIFSTLMHFVDFFFVGGLGADALAAVQVSFPIFFLVIAIGSGINIGTTSLIAKRLGQKNKLWAEETVLHGLVLAAVISALFVLLIFVVDGLAAGLGGGPQIGALAAEYLRVFFSGVIVFFVLFALQAAMQGEGDTKTPMKLSILFTVANMILDPIFIYTLDMGIAGAGLATVVSAALALAFAIWYVVIAKKTYLQIKPKELIFTPQILKNIMKVGLPAAISQIALSIAVFIVNNLLSGFGDSAISAYGIGFRVDSLAIMPMLGLAAGVIPMVGFFRGAQDFEGARKVTHLAIKMTFVFGLIVAAVIFLFAELLASLFSEDAYLVSLATDYLRIIAISYPFIGTMIVSSATFQGLGKGVPSLVITMTRAVILLLPFAYYLAFIAGLGTDGIWWGLTCSITLTAAIAFVWIESYYKGICRACD